jgi:hypothetical protein
MMLNIKGLEAISKTLGEIVKSHVAKAFDTLSVRIKAIEDAVSSIEPAQKGEKGDKGDPGERGLDGKSITAEDVAPVLESAVAKWALEFERRAQDALQKAIDKIPVPKDGKDGKDGRDGVGFDDLQVELDGQKTVIFKLQRGDIVKEFGLTLPMIIDCGIYKEDRSYAAGDGVTWGGSFWIAQKETSAKPDSPDSGWRLAVKRGRDGKDGRDGIDKTAPVSVK